MAAPRLDRLDRNLLINGNFDFWQRGVGPTQISAQGYLADRWSHTESLATGAATIERSTDVPNGQSLYSAKLTVTSAQASPAAGEISFFQQVIEGNFFREARGKDLTLSFYIKTSVTGTWFLSFRNGGVNRTLLKPFTVSVANTWTKILINFTHDETGTWLYDTGAGLRVGLTLAAGTSWHSVTTNAWENGQFYSTASGVNFFAVNGSTLFLSQMKLQIGEFDEVEFSTAGRDYADELRLCQRYFEKTYNESIAPGTASQENSALQARWGTNPSSSDELYAYFYFKATKRAQPTTVIYNPATGAVGSFSRDGGGTIAAQVWNAQATPNWTVATNSVASTTSVHRAHMTADAEL